jgi:hypothetical protein
VWNDKYNITGDEPNDQDLYNILIDKNTDKYRYIIMSSAFLEKIPCAEYFKHKRGHM